MHNKNNNNNMAPIYLHVLNNITPSHPVLSGHLQLIQMLLGQRMEGVGWAPAA